MNTSSSTPESIAKFEIQGALGSGAMGVVYKAYDRQIERIVAVKILHEHLRTGEQGKELEIRFVQEAKAAARCLHPNIVTIFDFGNEGTPYIAMEYVEGLELRAHLKGDTDIPLHSATDITIQVLEALGHAHDKGVIHRDIKPSNIILLENGSIKVTDFGVARLDTSELTSTGYLVGTPNYMSPEALLGNPVDTRSDFYSVGVLFYEMLCRAVPARGDSLDKSIGELSQVRNLTPASVHSIKPILRRALQPSPEDRYNSASDFIRDLRSIEELDLTLATTVQFPRPSSYKVSSQMPSASAASSSQWSDELLNSLEQSLARHVGPVAKILVKKNVRSSTSIDQLIASLIRHIPNEEERSQFARSVSTADRSLSRVTSGSGIHSRVEKPEPERPAPEPQQNQWTDVQKAELVKLLAYHAGPLAGRMVKKALAQNSSQAQAIIALADHISNDTEREDFITRCHAL